LYHLPSITLETQERGHIPMKRMIRATSNSDKRKMKQKTRQVNKEIAIDILQSLTPNQKVQLEKVLDRNEALTSTFGLPFGTLRVYKEGWYLTCEGTRCQFSAWCSDNDGTLVPGRKPNERTLNFLYEDSLTFNSLGEDDWHDFVRS